MVRFQDELEDCEHATNNTTVQVLNKRKPVHLIPQPTNLTDTTEVYVMKGTDEVFTDYEKYIKRFDWLNQKKFTDAVNGKSGLTYWDALQSETKSSKVIENVFPEVLRDPILRKVQFSTISRMDELVNTIFDEFKHDFFPGEDVTVSFDNGDQFQGVIREKAKFPMIRAADGSVQREPFSRYFVRINETESDEALADDKHIRRDRKVFTKQNLRSFLKNSLQREAWTGAPWLVKEHLAIHYRLPMEIPAHLLQDARLLIHKQQMLSSRQPKGRKSKNLTAQDFSRMQLDDARLHGQNPQQHPGAPQQHSHPNNAQVQIRPPAPPPIKYPIEDLDVAPKRNGVTRPELSFLTKEMETHIRGARKASFEGLEMDSMGMLLEVWNTLNVQCEVYVLDSFTFDDFVDAMNYSNLETPCELLDEIHCAVLKLFLDDKGAVQVKDLPKQQKVEENGDDSEMQDESEVSTPVLDVPARSTRSRLSFMESAADTEQVPGERGNRAAEMVADRDWVERLQASEFEDGGWQVIMIGILHQLSTNPKFEDRCKKILAELAPVEMEPNQETALVQYANLDINLRILALQMLTILTIRTEKVKDFLETCMEDMTDVRKRKIELQRARKTTAEEFAAKDQERKILLPEHMPESPKDESTHSIEPDMTEDTIELNGGGSTDGDEEAPGGRSLRRGNDRKRKREEEAARREKIKAEKAEAAKKETKAAKEFKKLVNEVEDLRKKIIQLEEQIDECDSDLREANVQRTKVLGKDRFCNRYYWFERNGQPFGGLPSSSTSSYGYANGRIWVQGPDDMEREGFIDRPKSEQNEYHSRFHCTVPERRAQEEGATILQNASEWGFYDNPDRLDALIGWLDERGEREKNLRKELMMWRDKIVQYMTAYHDFVHREERKKLEEEETKEVVLATRINTRHKVAEEKAEDVERCCRWTNSMAMNELGHIHSRPNKGRREKVKKGVAVPVGRAGKPATRQGERYSFK